MKLTNIKTADIHALAKSLGIKNLKAAGRSREVIIDEIIAIKGWGDHDEATVEFLFKGGEIKKCRDATTDKPPIGNQASAGKTKRKGQTEFDKRAKHYIACCRAAVEKLTASNLESFERFATDSGVWPITNDTQIWGDGGLCDVATRWGLKVKLNETPENAEPKAPKEKRESKPKGERSNVSKEGLVSLASLCEKHGIDGKVARRKLRGKMEKPEAGWHFTPDQVNEVELIITK